MWADQPDTRTVRDMTFFINPIYMFTLKVISFLIIRHKIHYIINSSILQHERTYLFVYMQNQ